MVYLAGRNDLHRAMAHHAGELATDPGPVPEPSLNVATTALVALPGSTRRFVAGGPAHPLADVDSGSAAALVEFVRWSAATCPARRYALMVVGHGQGWAHGHRWSGLAVDDDHGTSIDTPSLRRASAQIHQLLGRRLDVLGLDACLMANFETTVELVSHVRVFVGSAAREPVAGWDYPAIRRGLAARPEMAATDLGALVVDTYAERFRLPVPPRSVTLTAVATSAMGRVVSAVDRLGDALATYLADDAAAATGLCDNQRSRWAQLEDARLDAFRYASDLSDLGSFCSCLLHIPGHEAELVRFAARRVLGLLHRRTNSGPIIRHAHVGTDYESTTGLSIYLPRRRLQDSYLGSNLVAARRPGWGSFLHTFHAAA
jgi:hypothetical protein